MRQRVSAWWSVKRGPELRFRLVAVYRYVFEYGGAKWFGVTLFAIPSVAAYQIGRTPRFVLSGGSKTPVAVSDEKHCQVVALDAAFYNGSTA